MNGRMNDVILATSRLIRRDITVTTDEWRMSTGIVSAARWEELTCLWLTSPYTCIPAASLGSLGKLL